MTDQWQARGPCQCARNINFRISIVKSVNSYLILSYESTPGLDMRMADFGEYLPVDVRLASGGAGADRRRVPLPAGTRWRPLRSGKELHGGAEAQVESPIGRPPVFLRADSPHAALLAGLAAC